MDSGLGSKTSGAGQQEAAARVRLVIHSLPSVSTASNCAFRRRGPRVGRGSRPGRCRPPGGAVALAGAAVVVAGRVSLRLEYIVALVFLGLSGWGCALAIGMWLRLLDTRRHLAIDTAQRHERLELALEPPCDRGLPWKSEASRRVC